MNQPSDQNTLIIIAGPTATGKTALAIQLALHLGTEIISLDARQIYKELTIGTAKPRPEELGMVRHHFINEIPIHQPYSAGQFERDALERLESIFQTRKVAIAAGGSGLYLQALCYGLSEMPEIDPARRSALSAMSLDQLREKLQQADPDYYQTVDKGNARRLIRALEVYESTGIPYSVFRKRRPVERDFRIILIGIDFERQELYNRINQRVDSMMKEGLLLEVEGLMEYSENQAMKTVGYQEFMDYFQGKCSLEESVELVKRNTRRYAKRQITWFKKYEDMRWFSADQIKEIKGYLTALLANK